MLSPDPNFDYHYLVYVKTDPAKEPVTIGYSIPGTLADASHKTGRTKADFEVVRDQPGAIRTNQGNNLFETQGLKVRLKSSELYYLW